MFHLDYIRIMTCITAVYHTGREMAIKAVQIGSPPAKTAPVAGRLYIAFRPVAFQTKILRVTGQTPHTRCLSPKTVTPVLEKQGVAVRRFGHVAVLAELLSGVAVIAIRFITFLGHTAMALFPVMTVCVRFLIFTPNPVANFAVAFHILLSMTKNTGLHGGENNIRIGSGRLLISVTLPTGDTGIFVYFVTESVVPVSRAGNASSRKIKAGMAKRTSLRWL